jgi:hypothetical protein
MSHANPSEMIVGEFGPALLDRKIEQTEAMVFLGVSVVCLIVGAELIAHGWIKNDGVLSWTLVGRTFLGALGAEIFVVNFRICWSKRGHRQFVHERGLREG